MGFSWNGGPSSLARHMARSIRNQREDEAEYRRRCKQDQMNGVGHWNDKVDVHMISFFIKFALILLVSPFVFLILGTAVVSILRALVQWAR